jgi:hypothetical protein
VVDLSADEAKPFYPSDQALGLDGVARMSLMQIRNTKQSVVQTAIAQVTLALHPCSLARPLTNSPVPFLSPHLSLHKVHQETAHAHNAIKVLSQALLGMSLSAAAATALSAASSALYAATASLTWAIKSKYESDIVQAKKDRETRLQLQAKLRTERETKAKEMAAMVEVSSLEVMANSNAAAAAQSSALARAQSWLSDMNGTFSITPITALPAVLNRAPAVLYRASTLGIGLAPN